jgi:uncharacterized iron-regulated protein
LPWPEASSAYRQQWDSVMGGEAGHLGHETDAPLDGQTLWDAAMAHSIALALKADPDALLLHVAGGFHVEKETGIAEALEHYRPGTRTLSVVLRAVDDVTAFDPSEHAGLGDFVVLTDASQRSGVGR